MALYTKDDIVAKARELALMISESNEVDFFKRAEAQINENKKISEMLAQIKFFRNRL
jgi:cell fate (sporulation/competence/biofilm development) regulator YmcA (YheA/YmcA/DUF963 family)